MKDGGTGALDTTVAGSGSGGTKGGDTRAFAPGQMLAGRWRIVRFLARGGMGEVYEAVDTELGVNVALKSVRGDVAAREGMIEQFKREIQLARQVTHPSVCRIYDLGAHEGTSFLTMELLAGETLAERIRSRGKLSITEAIPIAADLCAGLAAAHEVGVVHRDFKSGNVVLARRGDRERAVITDFGLAREGAADADRGAAAEATAPFIGTPGYMAPEQVLGQVAGPAADVYALGVVLFEMVTGRLPFLAATPIATAVARTRAPAPAATEFVPGLDPRWTRVIARCLEREAPARFAGAVDVARALAPEPPAARSPAVARLAIAITALAAAGFGAALALRPPPTASLHAAASRPRPSIAVLGFKNVTGAADAAWISTGLTEMLGTELAAGEQLRVIPGETIARAKRDLDLADTDGYAEDTLARLRGAIGVDYVLVGSYLDRPGEGGKRSLRVDLLLQDARTGDPVAQVGEQGLEDDLTQIAGRAGAALRAKTGVATPAASDVSQARAALPTTTAGARAYAEALVALRHFEPGRARDLLEAAIAAGQTSPLIYTALAQAWDMLDEDSKALAAATKAFEQSGSLAAASRLLVRGRYDKLAGEYDQAVRELEELQKLAPDDLDAGLLLVEAQRDAGHFDLALAALGRLRALPPPDGDDPRLDYTEAQIQVQLGKPRLSAEIAARAADKAAERGESQLRAEALDTEGLSLAIAGDLGGAERAALEARRLFEGAGNRGGLVNVLNDLAAASADQARRRQWFLDASSEALVIGARRTAANLMSNALVIDFEMGDARSAHADRERLLQLADAFTDTERARYLARIERELLLVDGEIDRAVDEFGTWWRERKPAAGAVGVELGHYANALRAADRLDEARQFYDRSVTTLGGGGAITFYVGAVHDRARLELLEGRAVEAAALAEDAVAKVRATGTRELLGYVEPELAWAHALLGRGDDAAREIAEALALPDLNDLRVALGRAQAALEIDAHAGAGTTADVARLEKVRAMAQSYRNPEALLEAGLALARHARDRAELNAIHDEAEMHGMRYLARRCTEAR